jgi:hypothetical protein
VNDIGKRNGASQSLVEQHKNNRISFLAGSPDIGIVHCQSVGAQVAGAYEGDNAMIVAR